MNDLFLSNLSALIGITYTIALLGHILYKGFIRKTEAAYVASHKKSK